jgi:hypothetical protein
MRKEALLVISKETNSDISKVVKPVEEGEEINGNQARGKEPAETNEEGGKLDNPWFSEYTDNRKSYNGLHLQFLSLH